MKNNSPKKIIDKNKVIKNSTRKYSLKKIFHEKIFDQKNIRPTITVGSEMSQIRLNINAAINHRNHVINFAETFYAKLLR